MLLGCERGCQDRPSYSKGCSAFPSAPLTFAVRSGSPLGYEGDPEERKELGPRARQSRRAEIPSLVPERRHCQGDPSHLSGSLKALNFVGVYPPLHSKVPPSHTTT